MATHSSILSWEIPLTEEPGRLQSMGLQRLSDGARTHSRSNIRQSLSRCLVLTHSGLPDSNTLEFSRTPRAGKAGQKHFPKPEGNSTLTKAPHGDAGLSISLPATAAGVLGGARSCVHPVPKCLKGTNLGLVKLPPSFFQVLLGKQCICKCRRTKLNALEITSVRPHCRTPSPRGRLRCWRRVSVPPLAPRNQRGRASQPPPARPSPRTTPSQPPHLRAGR